MKPETQLKIVTFLNAFAEEWKANPQMQRDVGESVGMLAANFLIRRRLRKLGATKLQIFAITPVMINLGLIATRSREILRHLEGSTAPKVKPATQHDNVFTFGR